MKTHIKSTLQMHAIVEQLPPNQQALALRMIEHYRDEYIHLRGKYPEYMVAGNFLMQIDYAINREKSLKSMITCKKGCAYCCHIKLSITYGEAALLLFACKNDGVEIDWDKLKRQSTKTDENYKTLSLEDQKCVFLNKDNTCRVYEYRPANCRKYFSTENPLKCNPRRTRTIRNYVIREAEILASAMLNASEYGSLYEMLNKALNNDKTP